MVFDASLMSNAPVAFFAAGIVATIVVAVSKAGFGGAMGSLSLPIMLLVLPPGPALAVLLPVFLLCDFYVGWKYFRTAVRRIVIIMTVAVMVGQLAGWLLFQHVNADTLMFLIGGLAVFTGGRYFWRIYKPAVAAAISRVAVRALRRNHARAGVWCGLAGFASFISLTGGIPAQVYLLPLNLPRAYFVGTMGWAFLLSNIAKLPFFLELDLFTTASVTASLALVPLVPLGVALGIWLNRVMSDLWFYHISHGFLLLLGVRPMAQNAPI